MLKIGLIWRGKIGAMHADLIAGHPGSELAAVCNPLDRAAEMRCFVLVDES